MIDMPDTVPTTRRADDLKGGAVADTADSSGDLQQQIEQARQDLAQSIDEIVDRVHPKKVAQRSVTQLKERLGLARKRSVERARDLSQLTSGKAADLKERSAELTGSSGVAGTSDPRRLPIRKEYAVAAGVAVGVGAVVFIIWYRSRS